MTRETRGPNQAFENFKYPQNAGVEVMAWGISRDLRRSQLDAVQLTRIMTEIEKIESS